MKQSNKLWINSAGSKIDPIPHITHKDSESYNSFFIKKRITCKGLATKIPVKNYCFNPNTEFVFFVSVSNPVIPNRPGPSWHTSWRQIVQNVLYGPASTHIYFKVAFTLRQNSLRMIREKTSLSSLYGGCSGSVNNDGNASETQLLKHLRAKQGFDNCCDVWHVSHSVSWESETWQSLGG